MIVNGNSNVNQNLYQANVSENRKMKGAVADNSSKNDAASKSNSAVELSISEEGQAALRGKLADMGITSEVYGDISKDEKVKTNEVEFEHYMNMLQIRGDALKEIKDNQGSYDVEDVMKTIRDAYETYYNQIIKEHENGDRQVYYDITGDRSISLEEDLEGLDKAYKQCLNDLEGYITIQQSNKILTSRNKNQETNAEQIKEDELEKPKYFEQEYQDTARSIMEEARKQFLSLFQSPDYNQGITGTVLRNPR